MRRLDDFMTDSFHRVELTFADQTFADGHFIIKSPLDREKGPVGPGRSEFSLFSKIKENSHFHWLKVSSHLKSVCLLGAKDLHLTEYFEQTAHGSAIEKDRTTRKTQF